MKLKYLLLLLLLCTSVISFGQKKKKSKFDDDESGGMKRFFYYGGGMQCYTLSGNYFKDIATDPNERHEYSAATVNQKLYGLNFTAGQNILLYSFYGESMSFGVSPNLGVWVTDYKNFPKVIGFNVPLYATYYFGSLATKRKYDKWGVGAGIGGQLHGLNLDFTLAQWLYVSPAGFVEFDYNILGENIRLRAGTSLLKYQYYYGSSHGDIPGPALQDFFVQLIRN